MRGRIRRSDVGCALVESRLTSRRNIRAALQSQRSMDGAIVLGNAGRSHRSTAHVLSPGPSLRQIQSQETRLVLCRGVAVFVYS